MQLFAHDEVSIASFRVGLHAGFGAGETTIGLAPLGEMRADTHDAPLRVGATLTDVNIARLTDDLRSKSTGEIAEDVERGARDRLRPFALRTLAVATLGALVTGVAVFRRRWRSTVIAGVTALVVVGGSLAATWRTFRPDAFAEPTFVGTLRLAPQLLGPANEITERLDAFRANVERIVGGAARAYAALEPQTIGGTGDLRVLHISDVHLNTIGMDFAVELASGFDVDLVIDTGDLTSYGTSVEEAIASQIPRFRRPYVFVRGNHDAPSVAARVDATKNGRVLEHEAKTVEGLRIYGAPHPAFTENQQEDVDSEELAERAREATDDLTEAVLGLRRRPDVVAVHDDRMAEGLGGVVPVVVSGHFHRSRAQTLDGTVFLRAGSTGGAGVNMFTEAEPVPLSAEVLYFDEEPTPRLVAYDLIEQSPTTGRLTIQRHVVGDEGAPISPSRTDDRAR
jgi:predicted phosphodiesterase